MAIYGPDLQESLDSFEGKAMVVVILGRDAEIRVWMSDEIKSEADHAWALEQFCLAKKVILELQGNPQQ